MRSAKLLIVAYKAFRRGEEDIAKEIFAEAMDDETAPELMETVKEEAGEDIDVDTDVGEEEEEDIIDIDEEEEEEEEEAGKETLSRVQKAKIRAIANQIAAKGHRTLARRLLRQIRDH